MSPIISHAFVLAMVMQAISAVFSEGMIFSIPGAWLERDAHFLWKMLMGCPVCMCPWYGASLILSLDLHHATWISVVVAMGINWVIGNLQTFQNISDESEQPGTGNSSSL